MELTTSYKYQVDNLIIATNTKALICTVIESVEHITKGYEGSFIRSGIFPFSVFLMGFFLKQVLKFDKPKFIVNNAYFILTFTMFCAITE